MRFILNILIRKYIDKYCNNEITKLKPEEELEAYRFTNSMGIEKIIRSNITIQTLRHFEAKTDQERWMVKGAALALQVIKDRHVYAVKLNSIKDKKKRVELWKKFKLN